MKYRYWESKGNFFIDWKLIMYIFMNFFRFEVYFFLKWVDGKFFVSNKNAYVYNYYFGF